MTEKLNMKHIKVCWQDKFTYGKKLHKGFCGSRGSWMYSDKFPPVISLGGWVALWVMQSAGFEEHSSGLARSLKSNYQNWYSEAR